MDFDQAVVWRRLLSNPGDYYIRVAEPEREEFRAAVTTLLGKGIVTVEFTKSDGTTRAMICTLSEQFGAKYTGMQESYRQSTRPRNVNLEVRTVWDINAGAWRSFRWDRLKKVEFSLG